MTTEDAVAVADTRARVAEASRVLAAHGGGDLIWGHVSARDPQDRGVWLKQASYGLEEITAEQVHLVSRDGEVLAGGGQRHSEFPIHTEIMALRPDVGAVVHVHSRFAVALAASGAPLRPVSHEANYFAPLGVPRYVETADLILTQSLGAQVAHALGAASALFLVNHGIVSVGPDVRTAAFAAVMLDRACAQQLLTSGYGGTPSWSDHEESLSKRRNIYTPEAIAQAWNYLLRQLP